MRLLNTEKIYSVNHLIFSDLHLLGEFLQNFSPQIVWCIK